MNWQAQLEALEALDRAGRFEQLQQALDRLPPAAPPEIQASLHYWRGKLLLQAGLFAEAIPALAEAASRQPDRAHAHYLLGVALVREHRWTDAQAALRQALLRQPELPPAAAELGQALLALGDFTEALASLEQAGGDQSSDPVIRSAIGRVRVRAAGIRQAPARVADLLRRGLPGSDGLAVEWLQISAGLVLAGEWALAEAWLEALLTPSGSLEACSHPLPRRLALILRIGLALLLPEPSPAAAQALVARLRASQWLPPAAQESRLLPDLLHPLQHLLQGRLRRSAVALTPVQRQLLEAFELGVVAVTPATFSPEPVTPTVLEQASSARDPSADLADLSEDLPALLQLWPELLQQRDQSIAAQRRRLERGLIDLSRLLLDRPNRLVLHPDPWLQRRGIVLREQGVDLLWRGCLRLAALTPPRPRRTPPYRRWLLLATDDLPQCFLYRVQQKQEQLLALGADCRIVRREQLDDWVWTEQLLWADAVIVCRLPALHAVLRAIAAARRAGLMVLYDIDDLIFDAEHCPPALESYGGTLDPERHRRFALDVPLFAAAMRVCDGVVMSTPTLARRWRDLQGGSAPPQPVWVLSNLAPPSLSQVRRAPRVMQAEESLRLVVASGTTAHKQAWQEELAPALAALLERYPRLGLDLLGHLSVPLVLQPFAARIRCRPFCEYPTYLQQLAEAQIGLVVLEDGLFTDAKSAIRWMEFSYLGLAAVLSPTRTYRELLQDGQHALFARGQQAWIAQIERLILDRELRLTIASEAQRHALMLFGAHQAEAFWRPWIGGGQAHQPQPVHLPSHRRRLLISNVFFAPQSIGGATRVVQDHVEALVEHARERYAVTVLCTDHSPWQTAPGSGPERPWRPVEPLAVDCHDWQGARVVRLALPPRPWRQHDDASVATFCRWWLEQERFDLIHAHCMQVLSVAPLQVAHDLGIPYAITLHDGWWLSPRQFLVTASGRPIDPADPLAHYDARDLQPAELLEADLERRRVLEEVLNRAGARLAVSEAFAAVHRQAGIADVDVMENRWQPMPAGLPRRPRSPGEPLRACFVGGMALHKGFAVLQAALLIADPPAPGLRLTVVDATLRPDETYQLQWGTTPVHCVPAVPMASMAAFYAEHDVLLAPSIWPESYGLVTREALSAGLWVVASEIGALADPIRHGLNGHRVPPRDPESLAAVLVELCVSPPRTQPLLAFPAASQPLHQELDQLYQRLID